MTDTTTSTKALDGRIALVTGASRGIGRAVAKRYAEEGAHVIALARTQGGLEDLDDEIKAIGGQATLVPFDLTNFDQIDQMGAALFDRFGRLDILVGNAGILGELRPMGHQDPKTWDQVMGINLTANWRLLRSADPLLRQSDAGRVIMVTSSVGHEARAYWGAYAVSKAALEMMTKTYAAEQGKSSIRANLINPKATRTGMRAKAYPGEDPATLKTPQQTTDLFVKLAMPDCTAQGELFTADASTA